MPTTKAKKKTTTTKTAKKSPPKKKPTSKHVALLEAAREVLPKLKAGKTTLSAERDRLGLSGNGPLRKALTEVLGSKKAYQEMMVAGRGGKKK